MSTKKILYIIAGANGSGKTTFALNYTVLNNLYFINADEIAKSYDPNDISKHKVKAGKEFFRQLEVNLNGDKSFMIESTLSGKYLKNVITKAKEKEFKVVLIYLFLETQDENILRVQNRVLNGGHDIPRDDIKRRYSRSRKLFWDTYKDMADHWILFFNGDDNYELIAEDDEILDIEYFNLFKKDL
ncbi:MAG: zeta toxin family protein [Verrucomicrobiota bacterium]|nr:zeta toxin family protein [Verrucomicrobiota bacterium]